MIYFRYGLFVALEQPSCTVQEQIWHSICVCGHKIPECPKKLHAPNIAHLLGLKAVNKILAV